MWDCENCQDTGEVKTYVGVGENPDTDPCQECCLHQEFYHYICSDCGYEVDPGEIIDAIMDRMEDR